MQAETQSLQDLFELEFEARDTRVKLAQKYPVLPGEWHFSADDMERWLTEECGLTGVLRDNLQTIVTRLHRVGLPLEPVLVADHGRLPREGADGELQWIEETPPPAEEAAVNYFAIADFRAVKAGAGFARLIPPEQGEDGINVRGEVIPARAGKPVDLEPGDGAEFRAEDGVFVALIDGRAEIACGKLSVSRVLDIQQDVDFNTGSIEFAGIVNVGGCVREHFRVQAEDGVRVKGPVEAAFIQSGGTVLMLGGMNGRDSGLVEAAGDVVAKFLTNADVRAGGDVRVNKEIISSRVHGVRVIASAGAIAGGSITALDYIEAGQAGNEHGVRTVFAVNYDMPRHLQAEKVLARIRAIDKALQTIRDNLQVVEKKLELVSEETAERFFRMANRVQELETEAAQLQKQHAELTKPEKRRDGVIVIRDGIQPGVILRIGRYEKPVMQYYPGRRIVYFDEDKYDIVIAA